MTMPHRDIKAEADSHCRQVWGSAPPSMLLRQAQEATKQAFIYGAQFERDRQTNKKERTSE